MDVLSIEQHSTSIWFQDQLPDLVESSNTTNQYLFA